MLGNATHQAVYIDEAERARQMHVYDIMPPAIRAMCRSAPLNLDMRQVRRIRYRKADPIATLTSDILREYPDWRPI